MCVEVEQREDETERARGRRRRSRMRKVEKKSNTPLVCASGSFEVEARRRKEEHVEDGDE